MSNNNVTFVHIALIEYMIYGYVCYCLDMPLTNEEGIKRLQKLLAREERDYAWLARKINKTHQWVSRRMNGDTPMRLDDYGLMLAALEGNLAKV